MVFTLIVTLRVLGSNSAWVDQTMRVPMYAEGKQMDVVKKYVVKDHQLYIEAEYQNWQTEAGLQHTFKVWNVQLGYRPKLDN